MFVPSSELTFTVFGSSEPFLEIFSSKKFSRVVVYCSVIKVPVILFQATALIFYQSLFRLSRTFLFFSVFRCPSRVSLDILPFLPSVCQHFFTTFSSFLFGTISGMFYMILSTI